MPFIDSIRLGGASSAGTAFTVDRSLRLNDDDSAYLARTPSTEGNRKKWTLSFWFKRSNLGSNQNLFSTAGSDNTTFFDARFQSNDTLTIGVYTDYVLQTNQRFRDLAAWYHMVIVLDTLQATATNRLKLYINGSEVTSFSLDNRSTLVTINKSLGINSTNAFQIGRHALDGDKYFDGYLAEINLIDGQALTPSSFGETDSTTGQWNPKEYEGTYAKTGSQNDGSTFISGSTASNNLSAANAFNGTPTTSSADAGSMYQTALNGSYTVTLDHAISVSSTLSIQGYFSNANFNTYSSFFVNGSEQTVNNTPVSGTENGTNSGVFVVSFTGTINNFGLQSHPTSITGIAQLIVDGEVLINGFNDNGKNSFYLQFADNSGATATTLGKDTSGQSNNFTPNNFSVTAGAGNDSVSDTPTNNFCTFNPLKKNISTPLVYSEGNLQYNGVSGNNYLRSSTTIPVSSGKWYAEFKMVSGYSATDPTLRIGIITADAGHRDSNNDGLYYENTNNAVSVNYGAGGAIYVSNTSQITGLTTYTNNDVLGIALDLDNDKFFVSKNGTFFSNGTGTQDPAAGTNPLYSGGVITSRKSEGFEISFQGYSDKVVTADFGQQGFAYTPPAGFKAICTANLPVPAIKLPNKHFGTILYTGNGSSQTISDSNSVDFKPDWLWIKNRGQADNHQLHDAVRGPSKGLHSNSSAAEFTDANAVTAFNSNGFSMNNNYDSHNKSSETYVAWNWNAGDTDGKTYAVTVVSDSGNKYRFDGFGTSAVTLDLAEGGTYVFDWSDSSAQSHPIRFSTTSDGTHGGGSEYTTGVVKDDSAYKTTITVAASAPQLYYYCQNHSGMGGAVNTNSTLGSSNFDGTIQATVKANATAGFSIVTWTGNQTSGATLGHGLGVAPKATIVKRRDGTSNWISPFFDLQTAGKLNATDTFGSSYYSTFFTSQPTSTLLTIGSNDDINRNTSTYVAYVFSEVVGYSKFGTYVGNGNADGTMVYTGFRPAWIMLKRSDTDNNWHIADNKRQNPFNIVTAQIYPNLNNAEVAQNDLDILSNGFKIRRSANFHNASGGTYVYYAFAEAPFKNARAR